MREDSKAILQTGVTIAASTTPATATLPLLEDGSVPRYVRVLPEGNAYVKFAATPNLATATLGDVLVTPNEAEIFRTRGTQYIGVVVRTTSTNVNITPL